MPPNLMDYNPYFSSNTFQDKKKNDDCKKMHQLNNQNYSETFNLSPKIKCVFVGDGAVGKTSLIVSYTTNGYPTEYLPTAFDNYSVIVSVDNRQIRLQLCDTAGQDDFDALRPLCYSHTDVFMVCFSIISPTSFQNLKYKWIPEIKKHCPKALIILVGTQCDLRNDVQILINLARHKEEPVSDIEAKNFARKIGALKYIECSALTQKNLKEVFDTAILDSLKNRGYLPKSPLNERRKGTKKLFNCCNSITSTKDTVTNSRQESKSKKCKLRIRKLCCSF